jgi:hypothetical protein
MEEISSSATLHFLNSKHQRLFIFFLFDFGVSEHIYVDSECGMRKYLLSFFYWFDGESEKESG